MLALHILQTCTNLIFWIATTPSITKLTPLKHPFVGLSFICNHLDGNILSYTWNLENGS